MQFSSAQHARQRFHYFFDSEEGREDDLERLEIPNENNERLGKIDSVTDWAVLWLLGGGDRDCGGSYTVFLQALSLTFVAVHTAPDIYGEDFLLVPPFERGDGEFPIDIHSDRYVLPLAFNPEFFEHVKQMSQAERRAYAHRFVDLVLSRSTTTR